MLWPHNRPIPDEIHNKVNQLGLNVRQGGAELLGAFFALPGYDADATAHLQAKVDKHDRLFEAIQHPRLSKQIALQLLRVSVQPLMGFLTRVTPLEVGQGPFASFDEKLLTSCSRRS